MTGLVFEVEPPLILPVPNRADVACFIGLVAQRDTEIPEALHKWLIAQGWLQSPADIPGQARPDLLDLPVPLESWQMFDRLFAWDRRPRQLTDTPAIQEGSQDVTPTQPRRPQSLGAIPIWGRPCGPSLPRGKALLRGPGRGSAAAKRTTGATPGTVSQTAAGLSPAVVGNTFESRQLARHRPAVRPARCLLRGPAGSARSGGLRCSLALHDDATQPKRAIRRMHASPERPPPTNGP